VGCAHGRSAGKLASLGAKITSRCIRSSPRRWGPRNGQAYLRSRGWCQPSPGAVCKRSTTFDSCSPHRRPVSRTAADPGTDSRGVGAFASLAHPGGNVTGYSTVAPELAQKRIALLHDLAPAVQRLGLLFNPINYLWDFSREQNERACRSLGIEPIFIEARSAEELEAGVSELVRRRGQALVIGDDDLFYRNRALLMSAAVVNRWPSAVAGREMVEAGGLMSYEAILADQLMRMATYIDRILHGAKPASLPVEQPTRFRMIVNLRTARSLGLTIPQALLLRADEVIG